MLPVSGQPNGQGGALSPATNTAGGVGGPSASPPGGTPKSMRRQRPPQTFAGMQQQGVARPSPEIIAQQQAQMQAQQAAQQQTAQQAPATYADQKAQIQPGAAPQTAQQNLAAMSGQWNAPQAGATGGEPQPQVMGPPPAAAGAQAAPTAMPATAAGGAAPAVGGAGAAQGGDLGGFLRQQVMAMLQDPTQGLNDAAQSNFDRQQRTLNQQFDDQRSSLNENLAARGLDASTIAASGLSRLGERQAQALGDASARIQEQLVRDRAAAMQSAISSAMGLRGQDAELDQMQWSRGDADRRFGLDQTLGLGNLDLNRQNLQLSRDRFGYDQFRDNRNFDYGVTRDQANDQFRNNQFDWQKSTDARDFGYRQNRDTIGDRQWQDQFDYRKGVDDRNFNYQQNRDTVGDQQWQSQFDRQGQWRTDDNQYRDRRDVIGDQRWQQTFDTANRNQNTQNLLGLLQGMGFNNISPTILNQIMSSLGLSGGAGNAPTGGGGSIGGMGGSPTYGTAF